MGAPPFHQVSEVGEVGGAPCLRTGCLAAKEDGVTETRGDSPQSFSAGWDGHANVSLDRAAFVPKSVIAVAVSPPRGIDVSGRRGTVDPPVGKGVLGRVSLGLRQTTTRRRLRLRQRFPSPTPGPPISTTAPAPADTITPTPYASLPALGCTSSGTAGRPTPPTTQTTTEPSRPYSTNNNHPRLDTGLLKAVIEREGPSDGLLIFESADSIIDGLSARSRSRLRTP